MSLGDIEEFLAQALSVLSPGARLAVISFHSLEDRLIKQFLQKHSKGQYPGMSCYPCCRPSAQKLLSKPERVAPSAAEIKSNPRARSAWLRSATCLKPKQAPDC